MNKLIFHLLSNSQLCCCCFVEVFLPDVFFSERCCALQERLFVVIFFCVQVVYFADLSSRTVTFHDRFSEHSFLLWIQLLFLRSFGVSETSHFRPLGFNHPIKRLCKITVLWNCTFWANTFHFKRTIILKACHTAVLGDQLHFKINTTIGL